MPSISIVYTARSKLHPIEDLSHAAEVDAAAVADGRKVPVFEAAAIVLEMDVTDQVLDLLELGTGVGIRIVIGDVPGVEVEPDVRVRHIAHQGKHRQGVLGRPFVGFQRERHTQIARDVSQATQMLDDRASFASRQPAGQPPRRKRRPRTIGPRSGFAARSARVRPGCGYRPHPRCSR